MITSPSEIRRPPARAVYQARAALFASPILFRFRFRFRYQGRAWTRQRLGGPDAVDDADPRERQHAISDLDDERREGANDLLLSVDHVELRPELALSLLDHP